MVWLVNTHHRRRGSRPRSTTSTAPATGPGAGSWKTTAAGVHQRRRFGTQAVETTLMRGGIRRPLVARASAGTAARTVSRRWPTPPAPGGSGHDKPMESHERALRLRRRSCPRPAGRGRRTGWSVPVIRSERTHHRVAEEVPASGTSRCSSPGLFRRQAAPSSPDTRASCSDRRYVRCTFVALRLRQWRVERARGWRCRDTRHREHSTASFTVKNNDGSLQTFKSYSTFIRCPPARASGRPPCPAAHRKRAAAGLRLPRSTTELPLAL